MRGYLHVPTIPTPIPLSYTAGHLTFPACPPLPPRRSPSLSTETPVATLPSGFRDQLSRGPVPPRFAPSPLRPRAPPCRNDPEQLAPETRDPPAPPPPRHTPLRLPPRGSVARWAFQTPVSPKPVEVEPSLRLQSGQSRAGGGEGCCRATGVAR